MRVLRPGGRLVFGDMMFSWSPAEERNREVVWSKVRAIARRGPAGWLRLLRNVGRMLIGRGERPASPDWWRIALLEAGFDSVEIEVLAHELHHVRKVIQAAILMTPSRWMRSAVARPQDVVQLLRGPALQRRSQRAL